MCRYAYHDYKEPFACFACRKVFKQQSRWLLPAERRPGPGEERRVPCPQCGAPMADMGKDFHAPRARDVKQWKKVELLYAAGFAFHSCGCCGPGYRPEELREVEAFLDAARPLSEGEALLARFRARPR